MTDSMVHDNRERAPSPRRPDPHRIITQLCDAHGDDEFNLLARQLVAATDHASERGRQVGFVSAADLVPRRVQWAWQGRIPLGMVTLLAGQGGLGKSMLTVEIAARITRGTLPGELFGTARRVLICSAEDAVEETMLPRLIAAGANLTMIEFPEVTQGGDRQMLTLPDDAEALAHRAAERQVAMIVADPLVAYLNNKINSWRDQDVRRALAPLKEAAEAQALAVLPIMHLNRRETAEALERISGSGGFANAARSVLFFGANPDQEHEDGNERVLLHAKCNVGGRMASLAYRIETRAVEVEDGLTETGRAIEIGETEVRADDVLRPVGSDERSAIHDARRLLEAELADGPRPAAEMFAVADQAGISKTTIERAKRRFGVRSTRPGGNGPWLWQLPRQPHTSGDLDDLDCLGGLGRGQDSQDSQDGQDSQVANSGDLDRPVGTAPCAACAHLIDRYGDKVPTIRCYQHRSRSPTLEAAILDPEKAELLRRSVGGEWIESDDDGGDE